jgi:predicted Zn-dependent protease
MRFLYLLILSSLYLGGCATSPMGRTQLTLLPDSQINAMGVEAFNTLKQDSPLERDAHVNAYVQCVTQAIAAVSGGQWEVVVFRDDEPNAFALPGGKIGVHTGLLKVATTQDQLAAVIGHEIAHVLAKHGNERVSQEFAVQIGLDLINAVAQPQTQTGQALLGLLGVGAQVGVLMPFSRVQESEADMLGIDLMAKAGFDPRASITLWQNMSAVSQGGTLEFLSTHPSHATRIQDLQQRMNLALHHYNQARQEGRAPMCSPASSGTSAPAAQTRTPATKLAPAKKRF